MLSNQISGPDLIKGDSQILEGRVLSRILSLGRTIQKVMVGVGPVGIACNLLVVGIWAYLQAKFPISSHLRGILRQFWGPNSCGVRATDCYSSLKFKI